MKYCLSWLFLLCFLCFLSNCQAPVITAVYPKPKERISFELKVIDQAQLHPEVVKRLEKNFLFYAEKVYRYHQKITPHPVKVFLSTTIGVGSYRRGRIDLPVDPSSPNENFITETFIHELGHHATGSNSSIFFKEGVASATLEEVISLEDKLPQSWAQYGQSNDAWVYLFQEAGELNSLEVLVNWPRYFFETIEGDYRSWQIYVAGGSFIRWYIKNYGYHTFQESFRRKQLHKSTAKLEKEWLTSIKKQNLSLFSPSQQLPKRPRYQWYAQRLEKALAQKNKKF